MPLTGAWSILKEKERKQNWHGRDHKYIQLKEKYVVSLVDEHMS